MTAQNINDLQIKTQILPLFDFTININSKVVLHDIFNNSLNSIEAITHRQKILEGFIQNNHLLDSYNYSFLSFNKAFNYLNSWHNPIPNTNLSFFSNKHVVSDVRDNIQLILLFFSKLELYFNHINLKCFPKEYKEEIRYFQQFLKSFNLKVYTSSLRIRRLKFKELKNICKHIDDLYKSNKISTFWDCLFRFEAYLSIAKGTCKHGFKFPEISPNSLDLKAFYHPSLSSPVKNNFKICNGVIVLNGANMSGKSTFLKAIGLCTYLGNLGLAIPADNNSTIPFCNYFSIGINKFDDISNGYSHFMNEVISLKDTLVNAKDSKFCFAIFDELFNGTDIDDAKLLIEKTISGLSKTTKGYFFISSHLKNLNHLKNENITFYHMECKLEDSQPMLTYKVKKGWSQINIGKILFDNEGLNELLG
ncbi:MAG: hypothetical protein HKP48_01840 [Winogradskyella sp.]|uniref:MutS-related protein n=1 Tax=Winogradskyella sp. TaxID=1883156 RepID=UPI0018197F6D|nr:hypothetical protein [Winogradskyella sp.]MBT8243747.1 hypothetical protein [Winogradskyella sp.]NNK22060.1 hypothetical protein [Winogradskyella sp.]